MGMTEEPDKNLRWFGYPSMYSLFVFVPLPLMHHIAPFVQKYPRNPKVEVWEWLEMMCFLTKMLFSCS